MDERNRTDLPHDQVARDNDGQVNNTDQNLINNREQNEALDDAYLGGLYDTEFLNGRADAMADNDVTGDFDEETAAEIAPGLNVGNTDRELEDRTGGERRGDTEQVEVEGGNTALGWTALVVSIVSLFFLPVLAGTIGVVTGFFAARNGARTLGTWAIAIGLFSIVLSLFIAPLVR